MSNYSGQSVAAEQQSPYSIERLPNEGELIFEDPHRRAAYKAIKDKTPNAKLNRALHQMANHEPPSHQARYFLTELGKLGISQVHGYDEDFGYSVRPEPAGDNR